MPKRGFGLRYSAFFRVSALGFRIWAAGGEWYCPVTQAQPAPRDFERPRAWSRLTRIGCGMSHSHPPRVIHEQESLAPARTHHFALTQPSSRDR
jgi:hypothetical protein